MKYRTTAADILREAAKDYELQAEALREQERADAEIKASDYYSISVSLTEVAKALEEAA